MCRRPSSGPRWCCDWFIRASTARSTSRWLWDPKIPVMPHISVVSFSCHRELPAWEPTSDGAAVDSVARAAVSPARHRSSDCRCARASPAPAGADHRTPRRPPGQFASIVARLSGRARRRRPHDHGRRRRCGSTRYCRNRSPVRQRLRSKKAPADLIGYQFDVAASSRRKQRQTRGHGFQKRVP